MSEFEKAQNIVSKIAELSIQLNKLGIISQNCKIPDDYAKWFCLHKFSLKLSDKENSGYFAISKFGEKVQIRSKIGSDIDFTLSFDNLFLNEFDYLLIVFINKETWMIDSIYKVSHDTLKDFFNSKNSSFKWNRESRSLSLQVYPEEDNRITI
ncbi:MAG: hypothetical protein P8Y18_04125 [Candidatus Bathyarchaeota archaeon]